VLVRRDLMLRVRRVLRVVEIVALHDWTGCALFGRSMAPAEADSAHTFAASS
jgi:hypothetical protein